MNIEFEDNNDDNLFGEATPNDKAQLLGLAVMINQYYDQRGLVWPGRKEALLWALTELAEAAELVLEDGGSWVRNHPLEREDYSPERFAEELGDVMMMVMVAGMVVGVDPQQALQQKLRRKVAGYIDLEDGVLNERDDD